ncbi:hypothetical protein FQA47_008432 [Oryzias melastigma]|uniref:Uncharacterized protein n=1 Tax=Oryzias melastigma TaxID=30732 RepID=A0A834CQ36_ORYME|nr:hypothetical protein FQA47_008432 [Oryzias melastigma]
MRKGLSGSESGLSWSGDGVRRWRRQSRTGSAEQCGYATSSSGSAPPASVHQRYYTCLPPSFKSESAAAVPVNLRGRISSSRVHLGAAASTSSSTFICRMKSTTPPPAKSRLLPATMKRRLNGLRRSPRLPCKLLTFNRQRSSACVCDEQRAVQ